MVRYSIIVSGRVQGVGFRYFAQTVASMINLTGYARNCDNGNVELEVQGDETIILKFMEKLRKGNGFCLIKDFSMKAIPIVKNENKFKIKY